VDMELVVKGRFCNGLFYIFLHIPRSTAGEFWKQTNTQL